MTTTYGDNQVYSWNMESREQALLGNESAILPGNLVYTENWLAYFAIGNQLRLLRWGSDFQTLDVDRVNSEELESLSAMVLHPTEPILVVSYSRNVIESPNRDGIIRLWNVDTLEVLNTIEITTPQDDPIFTLAFSPDGTMLASGGADGTVRLWGVPAD